MIINYNNNKIYNINLKYPHKDVDNITSDI